MDFVRDIMGGDEELTQYLLRLFGYVTLGVSLEEKFWLFIGDGRNGKGTLVKLIHWLLGRTGSRGAELQPGICLAIEPMFTLGTGDVHVEKRRLDRIHQGRRPRRPFRAHQRSRRTARRS